MATPILLIIIVETDVDYQTLEALSEAGIAAVTYVQGTGSGIWQAVRRPVDPNKTIVLAVIDADQQERAMDALRHHVGIDEPGRGIAFTLPIDRIAGVWQKLQQDPPEA